MQKDCPEQTAVWEEDSVSPIARLPGEILAEAFCWHILAVCSAAERKLYPAKDDFICPDVKPSYVSPPAPYSWLRIRHICRAWREVSLIYPELSTHIFLIHPECVQDLLSRSGTLPLHIYMSSSMFTYTQMSNVAASCGLLSAHFERIYYGSVPIPEDIVYSQPQPLMGGISRLMVLELNFWKASNPTSPIISNFTFPQLQRLTTRNGTIAALRPMLVSHLRVLRLLQCEPTSAENLLAILRPMQHLEELVLSNTISGEADWRQVRDTYLPGLRGTVDLPRLRLLSISERSALTGIPFLYCIAHPPSTAIRLSFKRLSSWHIRHGEGGCLLRLLSAKIDAWSDLDDPSLRSLRVGTSRGDLNFGVIVNVWRERLPLSALQNSPRDSTFFQISLDTDHKTFMTGLLHRLPLADVTAALIVDSASLWDAVDWEQLLSHLRSVEELTLRYEVFYTVQAEPRTARGLCPQLQVLRIHECAVDKPYFAVQQLPPNYARLAELARGIVANGGETLSVHAEAADWVGTVKGPPAEPLGQGPQTPRHWLATWVSEDSGLRAGYVDTWECASGGTVYVCTLMLYHYETSITSFEA
ncbi:uncharacterized protein PHACADRAFT_23708 [Phanerochaete carnosa HHB-10118-sp]|uniref:F-box domain-containing protein n=1 Tax=Phanerochaete carnosa (strain HHB-10118-sp) TaxID=650164 RepID=K5W8U1_PHACS|nr:uncharacterized protein PHACADRAFT_23708 [Phanerochaete carnosa HHB-10118-sp]EKM60328.1 hypothetical protein PHACADRAFT_23708 [Phanerochaete carnosa HHB-10118-sp]